MANWSQQIAMHAPQLVVGTFHGKQREQYDVHWIADHDVVITTYDVLAEGRKKDWKSPIYQVKWHRAVLDEAHIIKNRRTNASAACFKLVGQVRFTHARKDCYFGFLRRLTDVGA
eukprot:GHVN01066848.1.p1 GENE.GHVN01066848.1~~GHVN01066848.1.p1  ORF type:complete len:115 (-),score=11.90 GHVN01066848.1:91-435(-)